MSSKNDYTPEEWQLLLDVPPMVGTAVMVAGRSGLGSVKEAFAIANATLDAKRSFDDNELIQSLIHSREKDGDRSEVEKLSNPYRGREPAEIKEIAVNLCADAARLLDEKSAAKEARQFKEWTLSVGEQVANAAKEGGFLGIGGERVSEPEEDVLMAVASALGLATG